ncbi:LysR substrate-binding domain-containing protein [Pseudomonas viciae]|nr:LysR substrate-binding domain-containing protein [Pseudomonas viciae]
MYSPRCCWKTTCCWSPHRRCCKACHWKNVHDLARHTLLSGRTRSSDWQDWVEHAGIDPLNNLPPLQFDHMHLVLQAAVDGLGVALCPASLLGRDLSNGRLTCPLPSLRLPLARYYYGVSGDAVAETQVFVDWLLTHCGSELARDGGGRTNICAN